MIVTLFLFDSVKLSLLNMIVCLFHVCAGCQQYSDADVPEDPSSAKVSVCVRDFTYSSRDGRISFIHMRTGLKMSLPLEL